MPVNAYGVSDVGKKRERNEDSFLVAEEQGLFLVADGMGGHLGGECASRLATETIQEVVKQLQEDPESTLLMPGIVNRNHPGEQLRYAIRAASKRVFDESVLDVNLRGMGTTVVALLFDKEQEDGSRQVHLAHVGDSRAYLVRDDTIRQLTTDHSLVTEQLKAGIITPQEVKHHRLKNIITRSVGFQSDVECDVTALSIAPGDTFLLCSDGLTNMLEDKDILRLIARNDPKFVCERLIELANRRGGDDNVTVVVVSCV